MIVVDGGLVGSRAAAALQAQDVAVDATSSRTERQWQTMVRDDSVVVLGGPSRIQLTQAKQLLRRQWRRLTVISTADGLDQVQRLISMDEKAQAAGVSLVVGTAYAPGLSTLLAAWLCDSFDEVTEISTASFGTGGPTCARQHHGAMGSSGYEVREGVLRRVHAGTRRRLVWFPDPVGGADCFAAALPEPLLLHRHFPGVGRITADLACTRRDRFTARLPMLRRPHPEGLVGGLVVEVRGRRDGGVHHALAGCAVPQATGAAYAVVLAAQAAQRGEFDAGVVTLADVADRAQTVHTATSMVPVLTFDGSTTDATAALGDPHRVARKIQRFNYFQ